MSASFPRSITYSTGEPSYSEVQERTLIGKTLGNRYRLLREIGSGGMAWVYLAEDIVENELVAVKVLYPQFGEDLSYIQRFNREARLASTLTDPHIVRVLDYGADRDVYYLVMEYIEGQNLREMLSAKGPFSWKGALEIIDQLATALEHARLHGVVHRDIKPQNMMIDGGLLKVLDFGIARIPTLPSLTQSGFIGSPYYVSPEQAMGEEVDTRSDIYSSGIVLYELLSGKIPFEAKSPWSIISQHITSEPPPIRLPEGDIPGEVHRLLDGMIAKRPEDRFPTPMALRRATVAVLAGQPIPDNVLLDTQPLAPPDHAALAESLFQRALKAIDAEEWARAVELLNQTLEHDSKHAQAAEKLALAEQKSLLISLYNAARRAIKNKLWEDAVDNLTNIVELEPDYKDAGKLLEKARHSLEEEDARQFVITRYNEGVAHFETSRWESALEAFQEVQRLSPGFERVRHFLDEAERLNNPTLVRKLAQTASKYVPQGIWWRWGLVTVGLIVIFIAFFTFGNGDPVVGDNDGQQLKTLYEQAQQAIENDDTAQAIAILDQILKEDPNYADAATLKRELAATPTPTPTPIPTATPTPGLDPMAFSLDRAQEAVETGQWSEAVDTLNEMRAVDVEYEKARVASLFCDAYVGRGLDALASISPPDKEEEIIRAALADFEAGALECPRRTDLQDQAQRAAAYLEAVNTPKSDDDTLIQILTPIVAADPDYVGGNAKNLLYAAHLNRGDARREASESVGALSDYEAALALKVDDPSEAQTHRAELLISLSQQASVSQPTPEPVETTASSGAGENEPAVEEPTSEPVRISFAAPELIGPEDDTFFAGKLTEVFVEWQPVGALAEGEYYDLTIMHIFADQPTYWGLATTETRVQLVDTDIGVGRAGGDRFYWWVTVRKANTASAPDNIDLPISEQSEVKTFVWIP